MKMDTWRKQRQEEEEKNHTHLRACRIQGTVSTPPRHVRSFVALRELRTLRLPRFPVVLFSWLDERQSESRDAADARKARWRRELGTNS